MRVLIFHGYLLRGTGSNVYNARLCAALARLGHTVDLLSQERRPQEHDFVDAVGTWQEGEPRVRVLREPVRVTVWRPEIGPLLPVYVADRYEGFEARTLLECSDAEIEAYVQANVDAVRDVCARALPDVALANHLVMGPAILARAGLGFAAKIHGSALEYTVKPEPARFLPYAREGTDAAAGVLVGSRHTAESLWEAIGDPDLPARTRLGPPGVDTELFRPLAGESPSGRLAELAASVASEEPGGGGAFARDPRAAAGAIRHLAAAAGPRVVMVGKLIVSKGVDLLLAAWPLVHRANPGARLLVVGFGEYAPALERLWAALASGDLDQAREIASKGRGLEGGEEKPLRMLNAFLAESDAGYREAAREAGGSVAFAGRLEHDEVGRLIPATDALVFPSTFPEAFGMVAAEAAAAGVLPVSAAHSGAAEVSRALAATLPADIGELVSFPLGDGAVRGIATRLNTWRRLDEPTREGARRALVDTASELWGWEGVARGVLAASAGRLEELVPVPTD